MFQSAITRTFELTKIIDALPIGGN